MSSNKRNLVNFVDYSNDFVVCPRKIGDVDIVQDFKTLDEFTNTMFPDLETSDGIPESIVLTPKNENMYQINEKCMQRFRATEKTQVLKSTDTAYVPGKQTL